MVTESNAERDAQFGDFAEAQWPALWRFFYRATGDRHLAEDMSQETLLRLYRRYGRPEDACGAVSTGQEPGECLDASVAEHACGSTPIWERAVWTTARRLWISWLRSRRRTTSLDDSCELPDPRGADGAQEDLLDCARALRQLSPEQHRALVLQVVFEESREGIAALLGVKEERVHRLLQVARRHLRSATGATQGRGR